MVSSVCFTIGDIKKKAFNKAHNFKEMWEEDEKKALWDHKAKLNIDKLIEKNPMTTQLERKMMKYKQMIQDFDSMPRERNAFFISVHFGNVINSFKNQAKEWLDKHGNVLKQLGLKELEQIKETIE